MASGQSLHVQPLFPCLLVWVLNILLVPWIKLDLYGLGWLRAWPVGCAVAMLLALLTIVVVSVLATDRTLSLT